MSAGYLRQFTEHLEAAIHSSGRVTAYPEVPENGVLSGLATIRELSERQDEQRAMIGALLRGLARPGSHAAINNHGQPRYIGRSIATQP
jgi:hypothetical protein